MQFKFYNSGIFTALIEFRENEVFHDFLDVFSGEWSGMTKVKSPEKIYPVEMGRIFSKIQTSIEFDFKKIADEFMLDGDQYILQNNQENVKIFAHRGVPKPIDIVLFKNEFIGIVETERTGCTVIVKDGFEHLTPVKLWKELNASKELNKVKPCDRKMVSMRDGIKLCTYTWLPEVSGKKFSTVLIRTPYGSQDGFINYFLWLRKYVMRGFALVIQDVRGREESEGEWMPFYHERDDGFDTLEYIANQEWSDGKVGMIGASYSGGIQWAADSSGNEHLKAMISMVASGSPFGDIPRRGGAIFSGTMAWAFAMAERKMNPQNMIRDDWDQLIRHLPIKDIPLKGLGKEVPFISMWMAHEDNDEFWKETDWFSYANETNTPALIVSGWYDDNGMGSSEAWELCKKQNRKHTKMILGPWLHQINMTREINGIDFGNDATRYDMDRIYFDWFDKYLNDKENDIEKMPKVQYFLNGVNEWQSADTWPLKEEESTKLYLTEGSNAVFDNPCDSGSDSYEFNPLDPTPFLIDISANELNIPANYSEVESRKDVISYTTGTLDDDLIISGDLSAQIFAASSCRDTDWIVRVTEVLDEHTSIRISDGLIRAKYREGYDQKKLLVPDEVYEYNIKMYKIAHRFKKGSRIRVSIMSGAKNLIFPNLNTGNDPARETDYLIAKQSVHYGEQYPSHVCLPVIR